MRIKINILALNARALGGAQPESGYDKKNMAVDIHELVGSLGFITIPA